MVISKFTKKICLTIFITKYLFSSCFLLQFFLPGSGSKGKNLRKKKCGSGSTAMVFFYCLANYLHGLSHGVLWLECLDLEWDGLNVCSHQHELLDVAPGPHQVLRHNLHSVHLACIQQKRRVQSWDAQDIRPRNPANFISGRIPDMIAGHWVLKPGNQAKINR